MGAEPDVIEVLAIGATIPPATQLVSWLDIEPLTMVSQVPTRGFHEDLSPEAYARFVRLYLQVSVKEPWPRDCHIFVDSPLDHQAVDSIT
jgi:hypothetical protein